jgi:hypothetical protein
MADAMSEFASPDTAQIVDADGVRRRLALYGVRKLLLMAAVHVDETSWAGIHAAVRADDPTDGCRTHGG